jgi:hypothetical protein
VLRILRLSFWLLVAAGAVYFSATVPLGQRTFFGHLRAIAGTREAAALGEGTRAAADAFAERVRARLRGDAAPAVHAPATPLARNQSAP